MKLTNKEAEERYNGLMSIADKVTGKLAYCISRNIRKLNTELKEYLDVKNNCIEKYGELSEDGLYSLKLASSKYKEYLTEMKQYDNIEIEVDIMTIDAEQIYESTLNASEMLLIDFIVKEE